MPYMPYIPYTTFRRLVMEEGSERGNEERDLEERGAMRLPTAGRSWFPGRRDT